MFLNLLPRIGQSRKGDITDFACLTTENSKKKNDYLDRVKQRNLGKWTLASFASETKVATYTI